MDFFLRSLLLEQRGLFQGRALATLGVILIGLKAYASTVFSLSITARDCRLDRLILAPPGFVTARDLFTPRGASFLAGTPPRLVGCVLQGEVAPAIHGRLNRSRVIPATGRGTAARHLQNETHTAINERKSGGYTGKHKHAGSSARALCFSLCISAFH